MDDLEFTERTKQAMVSPGGIAVAQLTSRSAATQWRLVGRQGDIYVYRATRALPRLGTPTSEIVVAVGERTGHAHRVVGDDLMVMAGAERMMESSGLEAAVMLFASVGVNAVLRHDEHPAQPLEPGTYAFVRQRQYDWDTETPLPSEE